VGKQLEQLVRKSYLFIELNESGFELLSNVATEMVLENVLTEAFALLGLATTQCGGGTSW
jgi:hypothetical protein